MVQEILKKVKGSVKHWYIPLIIGLLFIALGIWTAFSPEKSYLSLAILFIWAFIIGGILEIYFAIANKEVLEHWGWELAGGILTLVIGIIMAMNPAISLITLPFYVGFVIMFRSIMAISSSLELKKYGVLDWGNLMALGILGLIFSFILLWNPMLAGFTIVFWTGLSLVVIGAYAIYFAFKLKKLKNMGDNIKEKING